MFWVQTVQTLGADRDKDSAAGPELIFGCRLWMSSRSRKLAEMKYQDNESDSEDVEIYVIRLLLQEE